MSKQQFQRSPLVPVLFDTGTVMTLNEVHLGQVRGAKVLAQAGWQHPSLPLHLVCRPAAGLAWQAGAPHHTRLHQQPALHFQPSQLDWDHIKTSELTMLHGTAQHVLQRGFDNCTCKTHTTHPDVSKRDGTVAVCR